MNKAQRYYSLYYSRKECSIKIKLLKPKDNSFFQYAQRECNNEYPIYRHNDCYYLSHDRKEIKKLALEIKNDWEGELKYNLKKIEEIKI